MKNCEIDIDKMYDFFTYLTKVMGLSHNSIGRAIGYRKAERLKELKFKCKTGMKIIKAYIHSYRKWCDIKKYDIEDVIKAHMLSIYKIKI